MKRTLIIVGIMAIIAGAVCTVGGFAAAGWDASKLDPVPYESKVYEASTAADGANAPDFTQLRSVSVEARGRIEVTRGGAFRVEYSECEYFRYDVQYENGAFNLKYVELKKPPITFFDIFGQSRVKYRVYVTIPNGVIPDLTVKTDDSGIYVNGGAYAGIDAGTENASVHIEAVAAKTIAARSENGSVRLEDISGGSVTAETSNSSIRLYDAELTDKAFLKTKNGSVKAERVQAAEFEAVTGNATASATDVTTQGLLKLSTSNGSVKVYGCKAAEVSVTSANGSVRIGTTEAPVLKAETTNGSIRVEQIVSDDVTLRTSNASVKGDIRGNRNDYTVSASTSNGSNNLSNGGEGAKKLNVSTTNGSIHIEFV